MTPPGTPRTHPEVTAPLAANDESLRRQRRPCWLGVTRSTTTQRWHRLVPIQRLVFGKDRRYTATLEELPSSTGKLLDHIMGGRLDCLVALCIVDSRREVHVP